MNTNVKIGLRAVPFVVATLIVAGCADTPVSSPADKALAAFQGGEWAKSRDLYADLNAKNPHNPTFELNLAASYQNLGRMDLAEPFYRQVLVDGKGIIPPSTTNATDANHSLADIACENLKMGLKDKAGC
jgi:hypothetical protein